MVNTFQNSAQVLSIGIFFTLIILGLAAGLPGASTTAWWPTESRPRRPPGLAPAPGGQPLCRLFGLNPVENLLGATTLHTCRRPRPLPDRASFFPGLIASPFKKGLNLAFDFAIISCLLAAVASALRGGKYVHGQDDVADRVEAELAAKGLADPAEADDRAESDDQAEVEAEVEGIRPSERGRHVGLPA